MIEKIPEKASSAIPAKAAVDVLLGQASELHEAPRSIAITLPEDMEEFAASLKSMAELPVEFELTQDRRRAALILTTGDRFSGRHHSMKFDQALMQRIESGTSHLHNHPTFKGDVKVAPSASDWMRLASLSGNDRTVRHAFIITKIGVTRYSFENKIPSILEILNVAKMVQIESLGLHRFPENIEDYTTEDLERMAIADTQLIEHIGGTMDVIRWEDTARISQALQEYLSA